MIKFLHVTFFFVNIENEHFYLNLRVAVLFFVIKEKKFQEVTYD